MMYRNVFNTTILIITLLSFSCARSEDENEPQNSNFIQRNGAFAGIEFGLINELESEYTLILSSNNFSNELPIHENDVFIAAFNLPKQSESDIVKVGSYEYLDPFNPEYDQTTNFSFALVGFGVNIRNGSFDPLDPDFYSENTLISGNITIKKATASYDITFSLLFEEAEINGKYKGTLGLINAL